MEERGPFKGKREDYRTCGDTSRGKAHQSSDAHDWGRDNSRNGSNQESSAGNCDWHGMLLHDTGNLYEC